MHGKTEHCETHIPHLRQPSKAQCHHTVTLGIFSTIQA